MPRQVLCTMETQDPRPGARMQGRPVMAKNDPELLLIGEFAKLAGTNLRTLRYYEERGLFKPARRSRGGFRY